MTWVVGVEFKLFHNQTDTFQSINFYDDVANLTRLYDFVNDKAFVASGVRQSAFQNARRLRQVFQALLAGWLRRSVKANRRRAWGDRDFRKQQRRCAQI